MTMIPVQNMSTGIHLLMSSELELGAAAGT